MDTVKTKSTRSIWKQFVLDLIENWIVTVCENKQEAMLVEWFWASAILLVNHRWKWKTFSSPNYDMINDIVSSISIPVFVRIRHWHFAEAEIAEKAWAKAIVEALREENGMQEPINKEDFQIPIISEIQNLDLIKDSNEKNWAYFLLLWDFWSWNVVSLIEKMKKWDLDKYWKVFIWWWVSSPADLQLINKNIAKWYFIWTALFYFETEKYFQEVIENFKI